MKASSQTVTDSQRMRLTAILIAIIGGGFILFMKFQAARLADSAALRSDALEGTVNVLAAIFGLFSLMFSEKPADPEHPYGHGKIEYFSKAFEGGLISLAAVLIIIDTLERISSAQGLAALDEGLKLNLLAGLGNGVIGGGLYLVGKKYHSEVLRADGIHLLTDLLTTVGMAIGLGLLLLTGWKWIDPALAFLVALFLLRTGVKLVKESARALLDEQNPELLEKIVGEINTLLSRPEHSHVITVHDLKTQEFGRDKHVDIHLVVPEFLSVQVAHDSADLFSSKLQIALGHDSVVHAHLDPCEKNFCKQCPLEACPIRVAPFVKRPPLDRETATETFQHSLSNL